MKRGLFRIMGAAGSCLLLSAINILACGQGSGSSSIVVLPTLGGSSFQPTALNATGQITGFSYTAGDTAAHAFLYSGSSISDLGTLGGNISQGFGLNAAGQVVGSSSLNGEAQTHAFLFDGTQMNDLTTLGGSYSSAQAINDAGQIVGTSLTLGDSEQEAFLYVSGMMTNLGDLGGGYSAAVAINQAGAIIGDSFTASFEYHAFIYTNGVMGDLGTLGADYSAASAINNSGVVVGESSTTNGDTHAFVYANGLMTDAGTLGGTSSSAYAVNDAGQVMGAASTLNDAEQHGFLYANGTMTDLGTLGGDYSSPSAINNIGQVVGDSANTNGDSHAFIWQNGQMTDLNTLLPANSGWELFTALFINDSHRIVGTGAQNGISSWYILDLAAAANRPPVAVAGPDQIVSCPASAILDATHSSDPDGDALSYEWSEGGNVFSTNATLSASLALGAHTITLKVTDPCGASAQTNLQVTVVDTNSPVIISGPAPATISADSNCQAPVPAVTSQIVASDNCTPADSLVIMQNPLPGTSAGLGDHNILVTVTDSAGNQTSGITLFSVVDTTAPTIVSTPGPITASVDGNCSAAALNVVSNVVATDNCTPANLLVITQSPAAGTSLGLGQHTITVTVTDASGNSSSADVSFKVVDSTAPTIVSTPDPITASVDGNCSAAVPNVVPNVAATDNCTPANQLVITQSPAAGTTLGLGQHTITVTVTDASGNASSADVSFKVVDTTAPSITSTPDPITASVDGNCSATVPNVVPNVAATDNCTPANQLVITQSPAAGTSLGLGQHTITVTVTDASGNSSSADVSFKVVDTTAPSITSTPGPITASVDGNCSATVPNVVPSVAATDNCTPANQLVITQSPAAGTSLGLGQHTITVSVTDASGNSSTASVSFKVVDTTAPTIVSTPGPISAAAGANCQAAVPNLIPNVVASDNCTPANQLVITQSPAAGTLVGGGEHDITITVTDASGNIASRTVPFTVAGTTPPTITSVSANPNVLSPPNHQLVPVTVSVSATDTCDPAPVSKIISVTCNETSAPGDVQITGNLTVTLAATRNASGPGRIYTITVRCTNAAGNSSTATVTVSVPKGSNKP